MRLCACVLWVVLFCFQGLCRRGRIPKDVDEADQAADAEAAAIEAAQEEHANAAPVGDVDVSDQHPGPAVQLPQPVHMLDDQSQPPAEPNDADMDAEVRKFIDSAVEMMELLSWQDNENTTHGLDDRFCSLILHTRQSGGDSCDMVDYVFWGNPSNLSGPLFFDDGTWKLKLSVLAQWPVESRLGCTIILRNTTVRPVRMRHARPEIPHRVVQLKAMWEFALLAKHYEPPLRACYICGGCDPHGVACCGRCGLVVHTTCIMQLLAERGDILHARFEEAAAAATVSYYDYQLRLWQKLFVRCVGVLNFKSNNTCNHINFCCTCSIFAIPPYCGISLLRNDSCRRDTNDAASRCSSCGRGAG